jgi:hypothetical protein
MQIGHVILTLQFMSMKMCGWEGLCELVMWPVYQNCLPLSYVCQYLKWNMFLYNSCEKLRKLYVCQFFYETKHKIVRC